VLMLCILPEISRAVKVFSSFAHNAGIDGEIFLPVFKAVGICICVRITAEICRDNGERAVAAAVELAGTAAGILCILPLLENALGRLGAA